MSVVALSPMAAEPPSPMLTSITPVTPTLDPVVSPSSPAAASPLSLNMEEGGASSLDPGPSRGPDPDSSRRSRKPPPLHTGADWKVVLHLPEIETWLRATGDRVTQLSHSVGQDGDGRHVDVHLVQLKDICEDISDHVEQIHALLETEFSLKLLSYSVNIIVDIRTVQLLWHQLRVSVLVLKERLLQGLQDSNGNFTRQTDILQAFSQDQHQTRLDALTEVDDCGQLTIRCSQDYFSLDCGITAFELSDYSPSDDPEAPEPRPGPEDPSSEPDHSRDPDQEPGSHLHNSLPDLSPAADSTNHNHPPVVLPTMQCGVSSHGEGAKRHLQGVSHSTEVSPTQPSLPKRAALLSATVEDTRGGVGKVSPFSGLHVQAELSRSTPSLVDPPDRSKFWLELDSVYPENVSQSYESLQVVDVSSRHGGSSEGSAQRLPSDQRSSSGAKPTAGGPRPLRGPVSQDETNQIQRMKKKTHAHSEEDSDSSLPSPMREQLLSSDLEASGEESDPRPPPGRTAVWIVKRQKGVPSAASPGREHWYGSEEFLALPAQLRKTEMLAVKLEGLTQSIPASFVEQLDGFISWLQEALDGTENWTQPRQDLDSLRVYLDTHLSFKMNVDDHGALKERIMEDGKALLATITSHQSGLKEILHMVSIQWDQLQRQIRRQHGWMLRALRCIQARLFYTSQSHGPFTALWEPSANQDAPCSGEGLKAELISGQCEAQRVALEQMAIKLSSLHYPPPASRRHCSQLLRNNSLQEFEAEYQEVWDWLMDMDAMVTDSHQLLMSEEQRHHLFKSSHAELMMMENRRTSLMGRAESLRRSGTELPRDFQQKVHNLTHTWRQLEKILSEHSGLSSVHQNQSSTAGAAGPAGGRGVQGENPRSALSPLTNSLLEQLEARIKELKAWLRDTELLIFNHCLRQDKDASEQLQSFKSLCLEIGARRRGVSSVLKLCQKLLQQSQSGPMAEVGPDAEQHREALQLLSINLERRWEAIVMQALQWQNRLKRELGERQVPGNFLEPGLVDLHQISPVSAGPAAPAPDDSWEWDETDMTITESEPQPDLTHDLPAGTHRASDGAGSDGNPLGRIRSLVPVGPGPETTSSMNVYQVYSLHTVELYNQPPLHPSSTLLHKTTSGRRKQQLLLKSLSKDSSFSSIESLPDLLGGLVSNSRGGDRRREGEGEGGRGSGRGSGDSANSRRSECESGIVSDTGDAETTMNSEPLGEEKEEEEEEERKGEDVEGSVSKHSQRNKMDMKKEKGRRRDETRRRYRRGGGEAVEILINGRGILTPADSDSDFEVGGVAEDSSKSFMSHNNLTELKVDGLETPALSRQASSPVLSQGSSLESLLALGVELFPSKDPMHRSASLENGLVASHGSDGETGGSVSSLRELDLGQRRGSEGGEAGRSSESVHGELSRRTLDLLKRLENIQSPLAANMTRSVSDMTLGSSSPQRSRLPASPSLGGRHAPLSGISCPTRRGPPSLINEGSGTASLTELSSTEDSSLGSEDLTALRHQRKLFLDPTAAPNANSGCYRKRCHGSRGGQGTEEADATSLSMVVNVSCTSACTDEDEDDSDLLSSSTLTLTEEELGVRDEEDEDEEEERLTGASSGNEEEEDEEEMEGSYVLGLEYMKRELQSWIRAPRASSSSSKTELWDELQCGSSLTSSFTSSSQNETNTNGGITKTQREKRGKEEEEENRRNLTRSYISRFVDDVENGNVEQSALKGKDEDDELLREESSVFTKKGESLRESLREESFREESFREESLREESFREESLREESLQDVDMTLKTESGSEKQLCSSPSCDLQPFASKRGSSLVGQLRGELPCHSSSLPSSPPSLSPVEDCRSHGGRKAITIQEKFKFSSFVTEQTRSEVRDKHSSLPPKKWHSSHASCCSHLPSPSSLRPRSVDEAKKENVHEFVMKIIDMTSLALKSKENQSEEPNQSESGGTVPDQGPAPLTQIRDKVLQHSHQPLHLRKGDFYSYLSLSSHDSDCGEVSQCSEEKSSTPGPFSVPCYSPDLFTSTNQQNSAQSSRRSSPSLDSRTLDLKSDADGGPAASPPPSPDIRDEETLFAACTEEVYLGPPLCYSMVLTKKPRRLLLDDASLRSRDNQLTEEAQISSSRDDSSSASSSSDCLRGPGSKPRLGPCSGSERGGEDRFLLCDAAAGDVASAALQEQRSRNEGPPYLNPRARVGLIVSSNAAAECLADTKALQSNTGAVMTEISVCGSATNPSKEPAPAAAAAATATATATRINPKINCSPMREADRREEEEEEEEEEDDAQQGKQEDREKRGRSSSQTTVKQVNMKSAVNHSTRTAQGRSQASVRPPTSRMLTFRGAGASRIQL